MAVYTGYKIYIIYKTDMDLLNNVSYQTETYINEYISLYLKCLNREDFLRIKTLYFNTTGFREKEETRRQFCE